MSLRRRTIGTTALAASLAIIGAGTVAAPSVRELVAEGNALYSQGDFTEAATRYEEAAAASAESPVIHFNLGDIAIQQFQYVKAADHFTRALQTDDSSLKAKAHYNLATALYLRAIEAMRTFQDAVTPLREAIGHYRESLRLNPNRMEARYNLELADRLLALLEEQQVLKQPNAGTRNQKPSPNEGQAHPEEMEKKRAAEQSETPQAEKREQESRGQQIGQGTPQAQNGAQTSDAASPDAMTPEAAEEMIEAIRDKSRSAQDTRLQWMRARLRDADIERYW